MDIAVLGAGALGSWFGGMLARQGRDVTLLTTNVAQLKAINQNGLILREKKKQGDDGQDCQESNIKVLAMHPDEFNQPVELVLLLTKTFQSRTALSSIANSIGEQTVILSLQNGLGNFDIISDFVSGERILLGNTMMPVDKVAPGIVESHGAGQTWFGHLRPEIEEIAFQIRDMMREASLDVHIDPDIMQRIWHKVAFNAGMNAATALSNGTPGTIGTSKGAMDFVVDVAAETVAVAAANGVTIELDSVRRTIEGACQGHQDHISSMRQDLMDARRTEVESLNGEISRLGRSAGIPTPLNDSLGTLIRLAETSNLRYRKS